MFTSGDDASGGVSTIDVTSATDLGNLLRQLSALQEKNYFANLIYIPSETLQSSLNGGEIDDNIFFLVQNAQLLISRLILLANGGDGATDRVVVEPPTAPLPLLRELTLTLRSFAYDLLPSELQQQVGEDGAALDGTTAFNHAISQRAVPLEHMVQSLFVLSFVSTKLRLELVLAQLKEQLQLELSTPGLEQTSSEYKSLQMVRTLAADFEGVYKNVLRFVPGALDLRGPPHSPSELQQFAHMVSRYYPQLTDWLLQVDVTLAASTGLFQADDSAAANPARTAHVTKVGLDAAQGIVDLSLAREDVNMPWGLLFNEQGKLVDVDLFVRLHASSAHSSQPLSGRGEIAHQLLKLSRTGAVIEAINGQPVLQPGDDTASLAVYAQRAMTALQQLAATSTNAKTGVVTGRKRLHLRVRSEGFKRFTARACIFPTRCTVPRAILSGAPVSLAFAKVSAEARWPFRCEQEVYTTTPSPVAALAAPSPTDTHLLLFRMDASVLEDRGSFLHLLPPEAAQFLRESCAAAAADGAERRELALVKVNGISVGSAAHAAQLLENGQPLSDEELRDSAEVVQLELVVLPPKAVRQAQFLRKHKMDPARDAIHVETLSILPTPPAAPAAVAAAAPRPIAERRHPVAETRPAVVAAAEPDTLALDATATAALQEDGVLSLEDAAEAIIAELQQHPRAPRERRPRKAKAVSNGKVVATFDNGVHLLEFDTHELVLQRPANVPSWGMRFSINDKVSPPTMELLSLPAVTQLDSKGAKLAHKFQKQFDKVAAKEGNWYLKQVGTRTIKNPKDILRYMSSLKKMKLSFWKR